MPKRTVHDASEHPSLEDESQNTKLAKFGIGTSGGKEDTTLSCCLPPHECLCFSSVSSYEEHYHQHHENRCIECQRNLPSQHFLTLHIAENHDPLRDALSQRGEIEVS